jgi:hypothetical protein
MRKEMKQLRETEQLVASSKVNPFDESGEIPLNGKIEPTNEPTPARPRMGSIKR